MGEEKASRALIPGGELDQALADFVRALLGKPADAIGNTLADVFGGLVGDHIREWRTRNLINALSKTADHLKRKGIPLDKVSALPTGQLYSLFESVSKEDDPLLSEMWSKLMSNTVDPESDVQAEPILLEAMRSLSPNDARILECLWSFETIQKEKEKIIYPYISRHLKDPKIPGLNEELERVKSANKKLYDEIVLKVENLSEIIEPISEANFQGSINNIVHLGLAFPPQPVNTHEKLIEIKRSYMSFDQNEFQFDYTTLANVMSKQDERLRSIAVRSAPRIEKGKLLPRQSALGPAALSLSDLGRRLMSACH